MYLIHTICYQLICIYSKKHQFIFKPLCWSNFWFYQFTLFADANVTCIMKIILQYTDLDTNILYVVVIITGIQISIEPVLLYLWYNGPFGRFKIIFLIRRMDSKKNSTNEINSDSFVWNEQNKSMMYTHILTLYDPILFRFIVKMDFLK